MTEVFSGKTKYLLLSLFVLIYAYYLFNFFNHTPDDAYITARYAKNLASGVGPTWNAGEGPVEGYSTFLWMIILSVFASFDVPIVFSGKLFGALLAVAWVPCTYMLARSVGGSHRTSTLAVGIFVLVPATAFWAVSGMESVLFGLLVTLSLYLFIQSRTWRGRVGASVAFGIAALTRHEGIVLLIAVAGITFLIEWRMTGFARAVLFTFPLILPAVVIYGSYFLWRLSYYGYLFPNPVYAKSAGVASVVRHPLMAITYLFPHLVVGTLAFSKLFTHRSEADSEGKWLPMTLGLASALFVLFSMVVTPSLMESHFSSDGSISTHSATLIYRLRILSGILGVLVGFLGYFANKNNIHISKEYIKLHRKRGIIYLIVSVVTFFFISAISKPVMMYGVRLFIPIIPSVSVLAAVGISELIPQNRNVLSNGWRSFTLLIALLLFVNPVGLDRPILLQSPDNVKIHDGSFNSPLYSATTLADFSEAYGDIIQDGPIQIGRWLNSHTNPNDYIATPHAGAIPYYCSCKVVELGNLNNLEATHGTLTPEDVLEKKPKFIVLKFNLDGSIAGSNINSQLYNYVHFKNEYELYKVVEYVTSSFVKYRGKQVDGPYKIYKIQS